MEIAAHIGLKEEVLSDKSRLAFTKVILSEVDKQNIKFDETEKSESKAMFMQDLITFVKGTIPPLENETGSVTEKDGSEDPSLQKKSCPEIRKRVA